VVSLSLIESEGQLTSQRFGGQASSIGSIAPLPMGRQEREEEFLL
jgi:hypothetical protein